MICTCAAGTEAVPIASAHTTAEKRVVDIGDILDEVRPDLVVGVGLFTILTTLFEGLCPSNSPTRALSRRCGGSLRSRGSFAALTRGDRGVAPRTPRHALSLAAATARSDRVARSRRSLAAIGAVPLELLDPL